jgi:hypothetical protein
VNVSPSECGEFFTCGSATPAAFVQFVPVVVIASEMDEACQLVPFHQRFVPLPEPGSRIVSRRL